MRQIADLHIHSRFSRACSKDLTLANIDKACRSKGVDIIATGDFTYPDWLKSIKEELEEIRGKNGATGLYRHKAAPDDRVKFILSTELALIYKKNDKCRRVHMVVQAPNIAAAAALSQALDRDYNIRSDGRPILGMSLESLCRLCFSIHPKFLVYPAHIWTPWFSVFGSKSGFDSWAEAFGEYAARITAYETGLSSDPAMNWRVSALDDLTLLSNSDAHSLSNIGREANVFELAEANYDEIYKVINRGKDEADRASYLDYTIEFYPEEGMYHYDGHRACGVSFSPQETKKHKGICPICKKPLVIGVDYRVDELADRELGFRPEKAPGYKKLVELDKIIAAAFGLKSRFAKKVAGEYGRLLQLMGTEMAILLDKPLPELKEVAGARIAEAIRRVRSGELRIVPGYDGEYGKIEIFGPGEQTQEKFF